MSKRFIYNHNSLAILFSCVLIFGNLIFIIVIQNHLIFASPKFNSVILWNKFTTDVSLEEKLSPPRLARTYALVHISIYDALLASENFKGLSSNNAKQDLISGAASEVLLYLFPNKKNKINDFILSHISDRDININNINRTFSDDFIIGQNVGKQIILYAKNDRSDTVFNNTIPIGECKWNGTEPIEPMAGQWKTFILTSGSEIQPTMPLPCNSQEYKTQVQQIINASHHRTTKQMKEIHFWGDIAPPIIWNNILDEHIEQYNLNMIDSARALAYLNVGMYDAGVSTWYTKFKHWTERPFQAAPGLVTVIPTPNFPGYTSGHSTFSGTASVILTEIFPNEKEFFESSANEANLSRVSAGIHLKQDCDEGLRVGKLIGNKVVKDMHRIQHTFIYK